MKIEKFLGLNKAVLAIASLLLSLLFFIFIMLVLEYLFLGTKEKANSSENEVSYCNGQIYAEIVGGTLCGRDLFPLLYIRPPYRSELSKLETNSMFHESICTEMHKKPSSTIIEDDNDEKYFYIVYSHLDKKNYKILNWKCGVV